MSKLKQYIRLKIANMCKCLLISQVNQCLFNISLCTTLPRKFKSTIQTDYGGV